MSSLFPRDSAFAQHDRWLAREQAKRDHVPFQEEIPGVGGQIDVPNPQHKQASREVVAHRDDLDFLSDLLGDVEARLEHGDMESLARRVGSALADLREAQAVVERIVH